MKSYLLNFAKRRKYILFAGDVAILILAILASYCIRIAINYHHISYEYLILKFSPLLLVIILLPHLLILYLFDQYNLNRLLSRFRTSGMMLLGTGLAGLLIGTILFFLPKYIFGRQVLLIYLIISTVFLVIWRSFVFEYCLSSENVRRLAYVGSTEILIDLLARLKSINSIELEVSCAVVEKKEEFDMHNTSVELFDSIEQLLIRHDYDVIVVDIASSWLTDEDLLHILKMKYTGVQVSDLPSFIKNITGKVPLAYINSSWIVNQLSIQRQVGRPYLHLKRLLDIIGSIILLILFFPIFVAIAVLVKFGSRGPIFFKQERLGKHRRPFTCLKFRSMIEDAEKLTGPSWATDNDPRITRVGKILRKTRFDEFPQLWNVLKGDISFVGPRPIREHFADILSSKIPYYALRFSVQPGLSGWAQVNYDYAGSEEGQREKFEFELFYIQNVSLFIDLLVIVKTMQILLKGMGK